MHDMAAVDLHPVQLTAVPLESDVIQLLVLYIIGTLHLYNVPRLTARWVKDVHPAVEPVTGKARLKQRLTQFQGNRGFPEVRPDVVSL